jgi:hypothetical protein
MRLLFGLLLTLTVSGCVEIPPTPAEQYQADMQATRTWVRGPLMEACSGLPGPESQQACAMRDESVLAKIRGTPFSHQQYFRIELANAKATDEMRRLWTRTEQEAWLRGPKTRACKYAPLAAHAESCLKSVRDDLAALSRPDNMDDDQPVVRAERAVARVEANERERAVDGQRELETDMAQHQAVEPALMVLGVGGELFGTSMATLPPQYLPQPVPQMPLTSLVPSPPVSCTSRHVGQMVYTSCY